jgi:hypothetical protein
MTHRGACGRWREDNLVSLCGHGAPARHAVHAVALDAIRKVCRADPAGDHEYVGAWAVDVVPPAARSATISRPEAEAVMCGA